MFAAIGQYVGGRLFTAIVVLATAGAGFWFWQHPEQLQDIWQVLKRVLVWLGLVLALPWAGFFVTGWVVKKESNVAAGALLLGLLAVDALFALYLSDWGFEGALSWMVVILGLLSAGIYNYLVCDFQAARFDDSL